MRSLSLAIFPILAPLASAQTPLVPTALLREGDMLAPGLRVERVNSVHVGPTGGYAATADTLAGAAGAPGGAVWGDLIDDGTTVPSVLRSTGTFNGRVQTSFYAVGFGGGTLAYEAVIDSPAGPIPSLWIGDDLQLEALTPSPLPGFVYVGFGAIEVTSSGAVTVGADLFAGFDFRTVVVDVPSGVVRLAPGDVVAGTGWTVFEVGSFDLSPSGNHFVAAVLLDDGAGSFRRAILIDGAILQIDGVEVLEGNLVPPRAGGDGSMRFDQFTGVAVDDLGRVAFANFGLFSATARVVRDGDLVVDDASRSPTTQLDRAYAVEMDPLGRTASLWDAITATEATEILLDDRWIGGVGVTPIDVDGDGAADGNWVLVDLTNTRRTGITPRGEVFVTGAIRDGADLRSALLRFRASPGTSICAGRPNSSGVPSQLVGAGSAVVTVNDLSLRAFDLPPSVLGYFLASRSSGFTAGPGGSAGDLCLGGSIGRYVGDVLDSGITGTFGFDLDLVSIPQPTGFVSVAAGETWYFQAWHRDAGASGPTSNFTPAIEVVFD